MNATNEPSRTARFARVFLPWLLAGAMFAVYLFTLDHWISPDSLRHVVHLTDPDWTPEISGPVTALVMYPLRWLPAARIPLAANLFSAICAALTLVFLARSVTLLPHTRALAVRSPDPDDMFVRVKRNAWLPPVLAAVVLGLQLSFWEQATTAAGEMFDTLLFVYLIRCLLEFRWDRRESWLWRFAFVNGLATADDWVMVAFLPLFLLALLWVLGLPKFFNARFVEDVLKGRVKPFKPLLASRLAGCWLAGASLFLLMPLMTGPMQSGNHGYCRGVLDALRADGILLTAFPAHVVLLLSITSIVPVILIAFHSPRFLSYGNPWARPFARGLSHAINVFFLGACLLTMIDSRLSPRHLQPGFPCLPLYCLTALNIGFFSGHFLVAFSARARKRQSSREQAAMLNAVSVTALVLVTLISPVALLSRNVPLIRRERRNALLTYFNTLINALPAPGAVIMSQDSARLRYLEAALAREGKAGDYALIDTSLLTRFPAYLQAIDRRKPNFKLTAGLGGATADITNAPALMRWMTNVSSAHEVYLMHPLAGYLDEIFYAKPRKLLYQLRVYPPKIIAEPPMAETELAENRAFWRQAGEEQLPMLLHRLQSATTPDASLRGRLLQFLHAQNEPDTTAILAGGDYSLMLNGWGVELQRSGFLPEAGEAFGVARQLNPENAASQINLACNQKLQKRQPLAMESDAHLEDFIGKHRDWDQSLRTDGPIDDPNSCYQLGVLLGRTHLTRQALQQWLRAQALVPDATNAPLRLGETFGQIGDYPNALLEANFVLRLAPRNSRALVTKGLALTELGNPRDAVPVLDDALSEKTDDTSARLVRALAYLKLDKFPAAHADYAQVAQATPGAYPAYYGLAQIALHDKDNAAAIKNCQLYLYYAPPNVPEAKQIKAWLDELKPAKNP